MEGTIEAATRGYTWLLVPTELGAKRAPIPYRPSSVPCVLGQFLDNVSGPSQSDQLRLSVRIL